MENWPGTDKSPFGKEKRHEPTHAQKNKSKSSGLEDRLKNRGKYLGERLISGSFIGGFVTDEAPLNPKDAKRAARELGFIVALDPEPEKIHGEGMVSGTSRELAHKAIANGPHENVAADFEASYRRTRFAKTTIAKQAAILHDPDSSFTQRANAAHALGSRARVLTEYLGGPDNFTIPQSILAVGKAERAKIAKVAKEEAALPSVIREDEHILRQGERLLKQAKPSEHSEADFAQARAALHVLRAELKHKKASIPITSATGLVEGALADAYAKDYISYDEVMRLRGYYEAGIKNLPPAKATPAARLENYTLNKYLQAGEQMRALGHIARGMVNSPALGNEPLVPLPNASQTTPHSPTQQVSALLNELIAGVDGDAGTDHALAKTYAKEGLLSKKTANKQPILKTRDMRTIIAAANAQITEALASGNQVDATEAEKILNLRSAVATAFKGGKVSLGVKAEHLESSEMLEQLKALQQRVNAQDRSKTRD
jgi:hypothetical protein